MLTRNRRNLGTLFTAMAALIAMAPLSGCMDRKLKPLNPCLISGVARRIEVSGVDKVDLLFVIDSSPSMLDEQEKLRAEIPPLVQALTTGVKADGTTFPPAKDINLGVVTTDMGLPGVPEAPALWQCQGLGKDGVLQTSPGAAWTSSDGTQTWNPDPNCAPTYPKFINYQASQGAAGATSATNEFSCLAQVGPSGCGFEMQLEAALKALTPNIAPPGRASVPNFLTDLNGAGAFGHGGIGGINDGFLRNDESQGQSLIAVILVTDEEDCSSNSIEHLRPIETAQPPFNDDLYNLRCANFPMNLWAVERYVDGLKALRPGQENLVIFGAITGVPTDLVSQAAIGAVDFTNKQASDAFYDGILADPNMEPRLDSSGRNLANACTPIGDTRGAKPAVRIVQVVKGFGENGVLQSICQDNYAGAIDNIVSIIAKELGQVCLPRPLVRDSQGMVGCKVVWELPVNSPGEAPTLCEDPNFPYLVADEKRPRSPTNLIRCQVNQLAVTNNMVPAGDGWYYDDFSDGAQECLGENKQRIAFGKKPPNGINVKLECLNEVQSVPQSRTDINFATYQATNTKPPTIGTDCGSDASACVLKTLAGDDNSMFCHPELNVCVRSCQSEHDCPAAWECDTREATVAGAGRPVCVNPICGTN